MKKRIGHYFLCVIIALSSIICAASTEDKGFDPKSILADVQDKMNKSKTFSVIEQQEKGGTKIEVRRVRAY